MPCEEAKEFLARHGIDFEDIDITELEDPRGELSAITGGPFGTPTIVIDGEARLGFDPAWIREKLGLA